MKTRIELIKSIEKNLNIAELVVFKGDFSLEIYKNCKPKNLYLVDLFDGLVTSGDVNGQNIENICGKDLFEIVSNKFINIDNTTIIKSDSVEFLKSIEDNILNFIYIDSSHQYNHTKNELFWSLKKINKKNGIIAGHDYDKDSFYEVYLAVNEFCQENNFALNATQEDGLNSFFIKIHEYY
jgi:hypothetical protein